MEKPVESVHNFSHMMKIRLYGNKMHRVYTGKSQLSTGKLTENPRRVIIFPQGGGESLLHIIEHFRDLQFLELMTVYEASNRIKGGQDYPHATRMEQLLLAEQEEVANEYSKVVLPPSS